MKKKTTKKRNYKAEYARRVALARTRGYSKAVARGHAPAGTFGIRAARSVGAVAGSNIKKTVKKKIRKDKKRVFGKDVPIREPHEDIPSFADRLVELKQRPEHEFKWLDEQEFINKVIALGLTPTEAYTMWFS